MKTNNLKMWTRMVLLSIVLTSCEEFVEVDIPNHKIASQAVFNNDEMAISAMTGIYNQLFLSSFSNGWSSSVTFLAGLSSDNMRPIRSTNQLAMQFERHEILPANSNNLNIWSSAYNIVYLANSILEGLENSTQISPDIRRRLEGEAKFVRAFTYFYLINLYGDVPLILTTDYQQNELAPRFSKEEIYHQITSDLMVSVSNLETEYAGGERTNINKYAAMALLARVHLYLENWQLAEDWSTQVIDQISTYRIIENLDEVFLANSPETIWQISPVGGGNALTHTNEGSVFIIDPTFTFFASIQLENEFAGIFENEDRRFSSWLGYNESLDAYFPYKYKISYSTSLPVEEYSMVLRLAEQYLIRAEARAEQGKISRAIEDVDVIRKRAGLELFNETSPDLAKEELLTLIIEEKRKELFAEWGHRWLDLKRTGKAGEVFGSDNTFWESTDVLYPIPEEELMKNPQLTQNPGY